MFNYQQRVEQSFTWAQLLHFCCFFHSPFISIGSTVDETGQMVYDDEDTVICLDVVELPFTTRAANVGLNTLLLKL